MAETDAQKSSEPAAASSSDRQITHVIFDFDGVLIDSERQYSLANARCLEPFGKVFTNEMKCAQMGRKKVDAVNVLLEMNDLTGVDTEQYVKRYEELLDELIPKSPALPGANKLIHHFYEHRVPLAICTGSDKEEFEQKTQKFGHWLEKIPLYVLCGSDPDVEFGKPHPQPYHVTARRFPTPPAAPHNVLVFEDSVNGVRSALAAGMTVIMVPQPEFLPPDWPEIRRELEPQLAEILDSLEHFDPVKYGLPALDASKTTTP